MASISFNVALVVFGMSAILLNLPEGKICYEILHEFIPKYDYTRQA